MSQRIMDDGPALDAIADVVTRFHDESPQFALDTIAQLVRNTGRECKQ